MAPPQEACRGIGARVCTIVVFLGALTACARRFGSVASSKYIEGRFTRSLLSAQTAVRKPILTQSGIFPQVQSPSVSCCPILRLQILPGVSPLIDRAPVQEVQTSSDGEEATFAKAGALAYCYPPPDRRNSTTTTTVVHGQEWFEVEVTIPIGGPVIRRRCSCEGSAFVTATVCTFYNDIFSQPARRCHHRRHGLLLPHSVQLVLCRVPV
jgi:hypothetical protein